MHDKLPKTNTKSKNNYKGRVIQKTTHALVLLNPQKPTRASVRSLAELSYKPQFPILPR